MTMKVHKVELKSKAHFGKRVPPGPLGEILITIPELTRAAVRMYFQGTSSARGKRPSWLYRLSDTRLVDISGSDDTELYFEAPTLGDSAEELYAQTQIWETRPSPELTAFDLLADTVIDISNDESESSRFDASLLKSVAGLNKLFSENIFQQAAIFGNQDKSSPIARLDKHLSNEARKLYQMTPSPRQVRLCGELDMIRASTQTFSLKMDSGEMVWGNYQTSNFAEMGSLFKQRVLVLGKASFRPSGHILRIDALEVLPANDSDSFFSRLPIELPRRRKDSLIIPKTALKGKGGISAIFGKWPGDESDEEFEEILREIS